MSTTEVWKTIPEYDGLCEVSNHGRVKSLRRRVWVQSRQCCKTVRERILKPINQYGFHAANLYGEDGVAMKHEIGELVLAAHVRPRPPGKDCCRFDGVQTNNVVTNSTGTTDRITDAGGISDRSRRHDARAQKLEGTRSMIYGELDEEDEGVALVCCLGCSRSGSFYIADILLGAVSSYCPSCQGKRSTLRLHGCTNMLSLYIASKDRHHAFWAGMEPLLQEAGITLSSMCWHGWQWNAEPDKSPPPSAWSKHALDCLEAASACDVLLF